MSFPEPVAGLVIRYTFLWSNEKAQGAYEGSKERPCAIIVAIKQDDGGIRAVVAPITHTPPSNVDDSIEVPASICKSLGLDRQKQWIRLDELNSFGWPGFDLRAIPGKPGQYDYGMIPKNFYLQIRQRILELNAVRKVRTTARDD